MALDCDGNRYQKPAQSNSGSAAIKAYCGPITFRKIITPHYGLFVEKRILLPHVPSIMSNEAKGFIWHGLLKKNKKRRNTNQ